MYLMIHVSGQVMYNQVKNPCLAADLCDNLCYNCTQSAGTNGSETICDSYCKPSLSQACSLTGSQSTQVLCLWVSWYSKYHKCLVCLFSVQKYERNILSGIREYKPLITLINYFPYTWEWSFQKKISLQYLGILNTNGRHVERWYPCTLR